MRAKITYEGTQRIDIYFVPELALREALINAICHKRYQSVVPIQVSVYKDKLYIANVGCLPENCTLDNLLGKHASVPYNPNIANVFYYAGFIESWGRGIEKIRNACEVEGMPMPEYTIKPSDIMIKFTASEDYIARVTDGVTNGVTNQEKRVIELLYEDLGLTMLVLAERMKVSRKSISNYLKSLREKNIIERIGSDRKGYWKINS